MSLPLFWCVYVGGNRACKYIFLLKRDQQPHATQSEHLSILLLFANQLC